MKLDPRYVRSIVASALDEDLGAEGDVTTDAVIPAGRRARAWLVAREELVLAGIDVAREVFRSLDPELSFEAHARDGERVAAGTRVATLEGSARTILRGERTALNFLMRMCGIANASRAAVDEIAGTGAQILDTRKTAPGLRRLDKYAVAAGGARNHRMGLHDAVMIKDTHLEAVSSLKQAVARVLERGHPPERVTVEVGDLEQLREALDSGAGRALLDNMDLPTMRRAVELAGGRMVLEASGGLKAGGLRAVAETGVDFLSLGGLTHSAPAADLAMDMETWTP
jgi:nicotinate-nucleotide pyrophosphorylase (carboxylating)